ncbi:DNA internalization-related competence protein ComEC/Rec2 [Pandoraea fibrosis]|uniref:DNA internalization-related competence protein ComEC/Rec2 n=1 Tax=Pandoraea fibrosis TaxID=1891094 RepID=A0ABX6HU46_9BURK|nr:DNA internalization-related competence protein ComEC/Rec2 [Pandoraea fibrosis]QHE92001.1 DNA internalization-related competence protein ComEC/Rec2 [Pandoraea fibrosis]QHF14442.1 DNA internalization-related competence protein ComEC/Rec2 [Pandoraea fibrosis]
MRLVLLAWVAGVWWLQQASALPAEKWLAAATGLVVGVLAACICWAVMRSRRAAGVPSAGAGAHLDQGDASAGAGWRQRCAVTVLALCAGVLGYSWAAFRAEARLSDRLSAGLEAKDLMVVGTVAALPVPTGDGLRFAFDVEHAYLVTDECVVPAPDVQEAGPAARDSRRHAEGGLAGCRAVHVPKHIELVWPGRAFGRQPGKSNRDAGQSQRLLPRSEVPSGAGRPRAGERWRLPVRLKPPRGFANWHGFDAELMALARGIRATGYVHASDGARRPLAARGAWRVQSGPMPGYRFAAWRERLRDDFRTALGPSARYGGVLMALALGERGDIADDDWQVFADTGVSHLLAISGLHVSLVAGVFAAVVGTFWRRACGRRFCLPLWWPAPKAAAVAGLLAAVAYGAVAGWGVPVRRAVGMVAIVVLALLSGRFAAPSYVLMWALAVIVTLDPWAVVTPGLWLSFGAVAALVLAARRRDRWRKAAQRAMPYAVLWQAARAQYAVTIGLVPLTLAWFGAVPLLGPLANAVAIPVMTLIVTPLALASLLLPATLAYWALAFAHGVVVWLAEWLGMLAALPWSVWRAAVAPGWVQLAAVGGVILCLVPLPVAWRKVAVLRAGIRVAGFALMAPAWLASSPRPGAEGFRVTMLDIGQGNAVLVETATRTLLFDAGPPLGRRSDAGRRVIVPYLRAHGVGRLDRLVVSHAHDDHFGGALSVLKAYSHAQVFSSLPATHRVRRAAGAHRTCLAGQQWTWDGVTFRFLHPDPATLREGWDGRIGPNGVSCVLRVSNGKHSALLAADAEAPQEHAMLARYGARLRSDILLVPHHGSLTSSTAAFVAAVSPDHAVFQTGYRNRFGHPRPAVVARYRAAGARIWQTVAHGGVRFSITRDGVEVQSYRADYRRYWHAALTGESDEPGIVSRVSAADAPDAPNAVSVGEIGSEPLGGADV